MKIIRILSILAAIGFSQGFFHGFPNAHAAVNVGVSRILVVVNKDTITSSEIEERIRLINISAGKPATSPVADSVRKQIIQGMIDELLQFQAATQKKIIIPDADVQTAFENLAKDNNMNADAMTRMLQGNGISKKTMLTRIRAQMAWGRYIREMYAPLVHISDQEVDRVLSQAESIKPSEPSPEFMEITLCQANFDITPETPDETMMIIGPKIEETHQAKGCIAFVKTARECGAKIEANRVVKLGQLPPALKTMVQKAKIGTCLQPAMTADGLVLTMVCSKTMPKADEPLKLTRDMATNAVEQEKLGKRAAQELAKLKSVGYIEWK
jgi:peptidyl-prolyl cis-trans isomerase SurA